MKLKAFQIKAIEALRDLIHLICISPTGSGKSLIFIRAIQRYRLRTLLIVPLTALARQHQKTLEEAGIHSRIQRQKFPHAEWDCWIISPEILQCPDFLDSLRSWSPQFLVVDECHSIEDWGNNFRPAFQKIPLLIQILKIDRSLWLSATLPPDSYHLLRAKISGPVKIQGGFSLPPNLIINKERITAAGRPLRLQQILNQEKGSGIVFTNTRNTCRRIGSLIQTIEPSSTTYHAGMSLEIRKNTEALFIAKKIRVLTATSAFGMGMDVSHLSWLVIYSPPFSILQLAQSMGRVARSLQEGRVYFFWDREDFQLNQWVIPRDKGEKQRKDFHQLYKLLTSPQNLEQGLDDYFEKLGEAPPVETTKFPATR